MWIYLIVINLTCYILYGIDKNAAREGRWRIPEKVLLGLPLLGGGIGAFLGMKIFHHKTKHWYFRYSLPILAIVQIIFVTILVF